MILTIVDRPTVKYGFIKCITQKVYPPESSLKRGL